MLTSCKGDAPEPLSQFLPHIKKQLLEEGCYRSEPDGENVQTVTLLRNEFLSDLKTGLKLKDFMESVPDTLCGDNIEKIPVPRERRPNRYLHIIRANSKVNLTSTKPGVKDLEMGGCYNLDHPRLQRHGPVLKHFAERLAGDYDRESNTFVGGIQNLAPEESVRNSKGSTGFGMRIMTGHGSVAPFVWTKQREEARLFSLHLQLLVSTLTGILKATFPEVFELIQWGRAEYGFYGPWGSDTLAQCQVNAGNFGAAGKSHALHCDSHDSELARTVHCVLNFGPGDGGHLYFPLHNFVLFAKIFTVCIFLGLLPHVVIPHSKANAIEHPTAFRISFVLYLSRGVMKPGWMTPHVEFNAEKIWLNWNNVEIERFWECRSFKDVCMEAFELSVSSIQKDHLRRGMEVNVHRDGLRKACKTVTFPATKYSPSMHIQYETVERMKNGKALATWNKHRSAVAEKSGDTNLIEAASVPFDNSDNLPIARIDGIYFVGELGGYIPRHGPLIVIIDVSNNSAFTGGRKADDNCTGLTHSRTS